MMFGTFRLFDPAADEPSAPTSLGRAFSRMAVRFRGTTRVRRVPSGGDPGTFAFRIERTGRPSLWLIRRRPPGPADELPATSLEPPWIDGPAQASTLSDESVPIRSSTGAIRLDVGSEPVFVERVS